MTGFFPLLRLQLLSRYADLKPRNLKSQLQEKKGRTLGKLFGYILLVLYLGGFLIFAESKILDALMTMGMPDLMLSIAVVVSMLGTFIMSFFFIMSSLYFGRDAAFIAALPVKPRTVLSAKLCQVWISEAGFSLLFILPAAILYGLRVHPGALFYGRALLVALAAPVLPIVLVAFVSTLLIRISSLWKRRDLVATVSGIIFLVAYMILAMNMGSITGSGEGNEVIAQFMQSYSARIESMTRLFPPAAWAAKGLLGDYALLLLFLAVSAGAMLLAVWAIGFAYQKLSKLLGEAPAGSGKKGGLRHASFSGASALKACCQREVRQILRVPSYATNSLPTAFMPVVMVVMMYIVLGRAAKDNGENFNVLMSQLPAGLALPILAAIMAYMAGLNPALATAVSREGRGHDFLCALPASYRTLIKAKLIVGYALSIAGVLVASALAAVFLPSYALQALMAFILCALYTFVTSCLSLCRDIKHPKLNWVTEQEAMKQNYGSLISMLIAWGLLIALAGLTYLLFTLKVDTYLYFAIMAALLLGLGFLAHEHLMRTADRFYCQG